MDGKRSFSTNTRSFGQQRRGFASSAHSGAPKKVALIGARGYTGSQLVNLFNNHPNLELTHVSSRELAGQKLQGYNKSDITYQNMSPEDVKTLQESGEIDAWIMALPNGVCKPFVDAVDAAQGPSKGVIVDLGADYRFEDSWTYGLPELYNREALRSATRISNPGCYSTSVQLLVAPLAKYISPQSPPTAFGISGYSGAGTKSGNQPKITPESLGGAVRPYSLTDHIHEREASTHLSTLTSQPFQLGFVPVVAPWFQGILTTVSVPLIEELRASNVRELFEESYEGEPLISLSKTVPELSDISGKHGFTAGGFQVHSGGRRAVIVVSISSQT